MVKKMSKGIEKMVEGAKETAVELTKGYTPEKSKMRNNLVHAGVSFGVYLFFSNFVEGSQPIIEIGSLGYAALKTYHAAKDYFSK